MLNGWAAANTFRARHNPWRDRNALATRRHDSCIMLVIIPGGIATLATARCGPGPRRRLVIIPGGIATRAVGVPVGHRRFARHNPWRDRNRYQGFCWK